MGEIKIADVRAQVALSMWTDFENFTTFKPHEQHDKAVRLMADEVIAWGAALKTLRTHEEHFHAGRIGDRTCAVHRCQELQRCRSVSTASEQSFLTRQLA